jgi:hypothetical protein
MKYFTLLSCIALIVFSSCRKPVEKVSPDSVGQTTIDQGNYTSTTGDIATQDVKIAPVPFQVPAQMVTISRNNNTVQLLYQQKISLMVYAATYNNSWGITFIQDFSAAAMGGYMYTNTNIAGNVTQDWATVNLNEVEKSKKDTVVNGANMVKVYFERSFKFTKEYTTATEASEQMELIAQRQDKVLFTTYYQPQPDVTKKNTFYLNVTYINAQNSNL